jgi:hypothetical protein
MHHIYERKEQKAFNCVEQGAKSKEQFNSTDQLYALRPQPSATSCPDLSLKERRFLAKIEF